MKIHCIVLTKNEDDIVGHCLKEAAKWADRIYVYDGQSADATWDVVKSLESEKIIPWKQDGKVFSEGLRAEVFEEFRHLSEEGDWWIELNADEFFEPGTREYLSSIGERCSLVWALAIEYYLTWRDIENIDFSLPMEQLLAKLKYYRITTSEPRCVRYRRNLVWPPQLKIPLHPGHVAPERIKYKHYKYRSPAQIQTRLDTRRDNRARGFDGWEWASQESWKDKIVDPGSCEFDDGSGDYVYDDGKISKYLDTPWKTAVKRLMHGTGRWP